jgi:predicted nucleic acid-binding protein
MVKSKENTKTYLLDTNVFIAAIKKPKKETKTLQLILAMIERDDILLVGDEFLAEEMLRYTEEFRSETATWILIALLEKMHIIDVGKNFIKICMKYIKTPDKADIIHAAVCLETGSILISNDSHFNKINREGIIKVWGITKAIKELL